MSVMDWERSSRRELIAVMLAGEHFLIGDDQPPYDAMELTCWIDTMFI